MKRVVITGAKGLIGWHAHTWLHAENCSAEFNEEEKPFDIIALDHASFDDDETLYTALDGASGVLHFAGINRGSDEDVEAANPAIALRLANACKAINVKPHIVYANSIHSYKNTAYGRSKSIAGKILARVGGLYTNLVLPHVFGECARPQYNNVTATFIESVILDKKPDVNPNGVVSLIHAGDVAKVSLDAIKNRAVGTIKLPYNEINVAKLLMLLRQFHMDYKDNIYPDLSDNFKLNLFNSYRAALYPSYFPKQMKLNTDPRGYLFEAVKGNGQVFLSTTKPGVTRGDHFHLQKVERFLVVQGEAIIRIRKVLNNDTWRFHVSGNAPASIDMPTLHTHSIENIGNTDLLTLFWTNDFFDPQNPDTFADKVLK